jgi:hypothetical protein
MARYFLDCLFLVAVTGKDAFLSSFWVDLVIVCLGSCKFQLVLLNGTVMIAARD